MGAKLLVIFSLAWLLPAAVLMAPVDNDDETDLKQEVCRTDIIDGRIIIDCSDQQLTDFPFDLNTDAHVLYLTNNNFVGFPPELEQFNNLEELSLAGNHLSGRLPNLVQNLRQLSILNLANNNFDSWANYGLNSTRLDLSKNKINNIEESAFNNMPFLTYLDLAENRISNLPHNLFLNTNKLDTLILSRNEFDTFPNFRSFSLKTLDLSNCQIATLEHNSFFGKSSLAEVNLSINEIDSIPDNIASSTLQTLDLSYNNISSISDQTFSSLPHLMVLDLRGNDFKEVWSTSHFSSNPHLNEVRVKGNRWNCEGFSINLLLTYEFLTREPPKVADTASLICYSPSNVTQMSWQEAYLQTWHQDSGYGPFTMSAIIFGIIIGVVITSFACRGLMSVTKPDPPRVIIREVETQNLNPSVSTDSVRRIPLTEDLPPSYDEALLMPRLNSSFHSLPGLVDEEEEPVDSRNFRRSRSIGDLVESPRRTERRSVVRSPRTVVETEE